MYVPIYLHTQNSIYRLYLGIEVGEDLVFILNSSRLFMLFLFKPVYALIYNAKVKFMS